MEGAGQMGFEGMSKCAEHCAVRVFDSGGPRGACSLRAREGEFSGAREVVVGRRCSVYRQARDA